MAVLIFFTVAIAVRLATLFVSKRNEARLRRDGAVEHGVRISTYLALWYTVLYLGALAEAGYRGLFNTNAISLVGVVIYLIGLIGLVLAIQGLGRFWTVKIMIASDHRIVATWIYRWLRHPNYFVGIVPELVGILIVAHAFWTALIGLPIYTVLLAIRIRQEEAEMRPVYATPYT